MPTWIRRAKMGVYDLSGCTRSTHCAAGLATSPQYGA